MKRKTLLCLLLILTLVGSQLPGSGFALHYGDHDESRGPGSAAWAILSSLENQSNLSIEWWMRFDRAYLGRYPFSLNNVDGVDLFAPLGYGGLSFVNGVRMILQHYPVLMSGNNPGIWSHYALTYQGSISQGGSSTDAILLLYVNGTHVDTVVSKHGDSGHSGLIDFKFPQNVAFVIGQEQDAFLGGLDPGQAFRGYIDEFRIWKVVRTAQQIQETWNKPQHLNASLAAASGLIGYWAFNEGVGTVAHESIYGREDLNLHLGVPNVLDFSTLKCGEADMKPVWTPSRVPTSQTVEHASTIEFLIPQNSAGYTLTIPLLLPEQLVSASILIKTLPTSSKLTLMKCCSEAQKQIAAQINDSLSYNENEQIDKYGFFRIAATTFADFVYDSFQLYILYDTTDIGSVTVNVAVSSPPSGISFSIEVKESMLAFISLPFVDEERSPVDVIIKSIPIRGRLFQVPPVSDPSILEIDHLIPHQITQSNTMVSHYGSIVAYLPDHGEYGISYASFDYSVRNSEESPLSNASTVTIHVEFVNDLVQAPDITIIHGIEDEPVMFGFDLTDPDTKWLTAILSKLPEEGTLYQVDIDPITNELKKGQAINSLGASSGQQYQQWVNKSLAWSSQFTGFEASKIEGLPRITSFGSGHAWFPSSSSNCKNLDPTGQTFYSEFIELEYSHPVIVQGMDIHQNIGGGAIVRILVEDPEREWFELWRGKRFTVGAILHIFSPIICESRFETNRIRLEINTCDTSWNAIDAARLIGFTELRQSVVKDLKHRLIFDPLPDYYGNVSFEYVATDCPYDRYRMTDTRKVTIMIAPVDDPPIAVPSTVIHNAGEKVVESIIELNFIDVDDDVDRFDLLSLPKYVIAQDLLTNETILTAPYRLKTPQVLIRTEDDFECISSTDSFTFRVTDQGGQFSDAKITIDLNCNVIFSISGALQIAIFISFSLVVSCVLFTTVFVYKHSSSPAIKFSSVLFCKLILFFNMLMAVGSIVYIISPENGSYICHLRSWITGLSIVGVMSNLVAKTDRIRKIFHNRRMKSIAITNAIILKQVFVMMAIELLILIVFSSTMLMEAKLVEGSGSTSGMFVWQCVPKDDVYYMLWAATQFFYIASYICTGAIVCFQTRNVPTAFNESIHIGFALFVILFLGVIIIPLQFLVDDNPNATSMLRTGGLLFGALGINLSLFGPKLYYTAKRNDNIQPAHTFKDDESSSTTVTLQKQLDDAKEKIQALSQKLSELSPNSVNTIAPNYPYNAETCTTNSSQGHLAHASKKKFFTSRIVP